MVAEERIVSVDADWRLTFPLVRLMSAQRLVTRLEWPPNPDSYHTAKDPDLENRGGHSGELDRCRYPHRASKIVGIKSFLSDSVVRVYSWQDGHNRLAPDPSEGQESVDS